jgi:hypothetical protein
MFNQSTSSRSRQAALAIGAALLASTALTGAADAKSFKRFHLDVHIGGSGFHVGHGYHRGWRFRRCNWLRRRAMWTGSPYWWRRYRWCMRRYY